jgi:RNA polymerase sigma-70 factor (ECF subfamily)
VRGDEFERLYSAHAEPLLAFLAYRTGDRALAEDAVADTFERLMRTRVRFDPRKSSEKTWIYTIALNIVRDQARRAAAETRALERASAPVPASQHPLEDVEGRDELRSALAALSPEEREAVALRFGGELTIPEVARVLGTSRATAHGRVYRALQKMRVKLAEGPPGPGPYESDPGVGGRRFSQQAEDPDIGVGGQDGAKVHRSAYRGGRPA